MSPVRTHAFHPPTQAPVLLRLVFHDAGTYRAASRDGGLNASIQYELDRPENKGLKRPWNVVQDLHKQLQVAIILVVACRLSRCFGVDAFLCVYWFKHAHVGKTRPHAHPHPLDNMHRVPQQRGYQRQTSLHGWVLRQWRSRGGPASLL